MARASTPTLLPLDTYCRLMGISPVNFNGGGPIPLATRLLFPIENASNCIWPQYSWQNHDQVCREELGQEISLAENGVKEFLKFSPSPDWIVGEMYNLPLHYAPEVGRNYIDTAGLDASINLRMGKFIASGQRKSTFLNTYGVVYSDVDGDGWSETATVTIPLTANTDYYSYKVYFSGYSGNDTWEIRPAKSKAIVGNNMVIKFHTWMMVDPDLWEAFATDENIGKSIDMSDMNSFVVSVDAYQVVNDETQPGCQFVTPLVGGGQDVQNGYLYLKDSHNIVVPVAADYNAATGLWETASYPADARYVRVWYYAGARMQNLNRSYDYISDSMALAISQITTARLERPFYANTNATTLAENLRYDMSSPEVGRYRAMPADLLTNPFGTKEGEWRAWRYVRNFAERVMGSAVV